MDKRCAKAAAASMIMERADSDSNLKLISVECGSKGLGIKLSKSTFDPYPFVSFVDGNSNAQAMGLEVGDCVLQVGNKLHKNIDTNE